MYFHDIHVRLTISHLDQASHMICLVHKELKLPRSISTYLLEAIAETGVINLLLGDEDPIQPHLYIKRGRGATLTNKKRLT
jgi:hypothetical protein